MSVGYLQRALTALAEGHPEALRAALIAAWKQRRSPRLAGFVELLDQRWPDELPKTLQSVVGSRVADSFSRLRKLDGVDDPRLSRFAIDALANPPFTAPTAQPFLEHLVGIVVRLRDGRLADREQDIRATLSVRLTRAPMRDSLISRVERAVQTLARTAPSALSAEDLRLEEELASRLEPLGTSAKTAEGFLAAIYAAPADDTARLVYADWLLERNDPRGEFIMLQFKRRDGGLDADGAAREKALLKRHGKAWLGSLASVISFGKGYSGSTFERGFLCVADIILSVGKKLEPLWRDPAWATVEQLEGSWPYELLERAPLRGLKRIGRVVADASMLSRLRRSELAAVEAIELRDLTGFTREVVMGAFPALRSIDLYTEAQTLERVRQVTSLGARRVAIHSFPGGDPDDFEALLRALAREHAQVDELLLTPAFSQWPRPAPLALLRRDGRYVRADGGQHAR